MDADLKQTPLLAQHEALGARMVPFAGWNMPVQYEGIIPEHTAVRTALGIFDISHMGQFFVSSADGTAACAWLDSVLTNNVASLETGQGQYSFLLNEAGGVIDDLIIYRQSATTFFLVVNASMIDEDYAWMDGRLPNDDSVTLTNRSDDYVGLAVQGPNTVAAAASLFGTDLPERFCMSELTIDGDAVIFCRTGYTGEDGFELFCPAASGATWWQKCVDAGAQPAGLGARDTLRLEKCYPLNGNDLSPQRTPLQAGLGFAVDLSKSDFIGKTVLDDQKANGMVDRLVALKQLDKSPPPRPGYKVYAGDEQVGELCSGVMSPTLKCGISMAYIRSGSHRIGTRLDVEIRGKRFPAEIIRKPFV